MVEQKWISLSKNLATKSKNIIKANETLRNPDGTHRKKGAQTHNITYEDILEVLENQEFKCAYTNLPLVPEYGKAGTQLYEPYHPLAPSLDRLDNSIGYELGNLQVCIRLFNLGFGAYKGEKDWILEELYGTRSI